MPKRFPISPPSWLTADPELRRELERQLNAGAPAIGERSGISTAALQAALRDLLKGAPAGIAERAILASFLRPCAPAAQEVASKFWRRRLAIAAGDLSRASQTMARITGRNGPGSRWTGAGWLVADRCLVTTRPVAAHAQAHFECGATARIAAVGIDRVSGLVFLSLETDMRLPAPIPLMDDDSGGAYIAAIGYSETSNRLTIAPGRVVTGGALLRHDCGAPGHSAGALLLDLDSGKAVGLHLGGFLEATAIGAPAIRRAMARQNIEASESNEAFTDDTFDADAHESVQRTAQDYAGRKGYQRNFLGIPVPLPKPTGTYKNDAVSYTGPDHKKTTLLPYTHFSAVLSKSRRLCLYAAVNIDGNQQKTLRRADKADRWLFDPRIGKTAQCGREIYRGGSLDLGHMVRRLDALWGEDYKLANEDTFHLTNACPQHKDLNRKVWNRLEDYIFKNIDSNHLKATVFTGPLLAARGASK